MLSLNLAGEDPLRLLTVILTGTLQVNFYSVCSLLVIVTSSCTTVKKTGFRVLHFSSFFFIVIF